MKVETVTCFKNSDGFVTESEVIAKRRQRVLNNKDKPKYSNDTLLGGYWFYKSDLKKASRTPKQIKADKETEALRLLDNKNKCNTCHGTGTQTESDYCGSYQVGCSDCSGTGYTKKYRDANPDRTFYRR